MTDVGRKMQMLLRRRTVSVMGSVNLLVIGASIGLTPRYDPIYEGKPLSEYLGTFYDNGISRGRVEKGQTWRTTWQRRTLTERLGKP